MARHYVKFVKREYPRGRRIGSFLGAKDPTQDLGNAMNIIKDFCNERDFKIHYCRMWNRNGETWFDVGSWSELFAVRPEISMEVLAEIHNKA